MTQPLRIVTWLTPGIPVRFFEQVGKHLADSLGRPTELTCDDRVSGPMPSREDVFAAAGADLGFLCSPSYLWLQRQRPISVSLVPAAPVPDGARAAGRPVYFSEVVVRNENPVTRLKQLAGR